LRTSVEIDLDEKLLAAATRRASARAAGGLQPGVDLPER